MYTPTKQNTEWPNDIGFINWKMITQKEFDQEYVMPLLQCKVPMSNKKPSIYTAI